MQELSVLADVVSRLEREGVPYALAGSVAMSCYVVHRTTVDTDIVVQLERRDARRIVGLFEDDYYVDLGAVDEAIRLHRSFNIIHYERLLKVDFIVAETTALLRQRFARRRRLTVEETEAWVLAPEDLILAKLELARGSRSERQISDVRGLLDGVSEIDHDYLNRSAAALGAVEIRTDGATMGDTSPEMEARYRAMVQARPPGGARFKIASDMFDVTRSLLIAGIRAEQPGISEGELRKELFLRYYGDEFSSEGRAKILAAIAAYLARQETAHDA